MNLIEIYCAGYQLIKNNFNYTEALDNFCSFADRVTICINNSSDSTLEEIIKYKYLKWGDKLNIINSNFSYDDLAFDGKIKNAALQSTQLPIKLLLDLDERVVVSSRKLWNEFAYSLLRQNKFYGFLIPSINLCKDIYHYKDIGYKFYLHLGGIKRGIVNFAQLPNGKIDIQKSDTTEPLLQDNSLAPFLRVDANLDLMKNNEIPYVFHFWGIDYKQRLIQNNFWSSVWNNRAGFEIKKEFNKEEDFEKIPVFEHKLRLWNE